MNITKIEKTLLAFVRQPLVTMFGIGLTMYFMGMLAATGNAWYWLGIFLSAVATTLVIKALPYNHQLRNDFRKHIIEWL